jgi:hypothetical protein|tara:strand:+ start:146 stop:352 length:207 start_codon:yes stop_codon:yes gene_type:complete
MLAEPFDYYIMFVGFIGIFTIGAILSEVAVWMAKMLGFNLEDKYDVDFEKRMIDGEVLDKDNMFNKYV